MKLFIYKTLVEKEREEVVLDIETDRGIDVLKFQIFSLSGIAPQEQLLLLGPAAHPIKDDVDLRALLSNVNQEEEDLFISAVRLTDMKGRETTCTRVYLGAKPAIQPIYVIPGSETAVCHACASFCFPPGLLASRIGAPLRPFACSSSELCAQGYGTYLYAPRLHEAEGIVGVQATVTNPEAPTATERVLPPPMLSLLSFLQEAAFTQQAFSFERTSLEARNMAGRLQGGYETARSYESPELQAKALKVIPLVNLHERAIAAGGDPQRYPHAYKDLLFKELLAWFKHRFFRWVNQPPCDGCGKGTNIVGGAAPTPEERAGQAGRVEVYKCNECPRQTRFPRYNDPGKLLETRRGRCGEWANCFTLCCRAMGYEARYILDFTDHVWTEVYSISLGRWIHADACENRADHPYMYEKGWGKKLSYVIGFAKDGVCDVTRRYTRKYDEVLSRRTEVPETILAAQITALDNHVRTQWLTADSGSSQSRSRELEDRARREVYELTCGLVLDAMPSKPGEFQGRISGDAVWKRLRGEDGDRSKSDAAPADVGGPPVPATLRTEVNVKFIDPIEREDIAGLRLGSASKEGPPHLLISSTSIGSSDTDLYKLGGAKYGPEAIMINGLPVAVGSRGLNVVIINLEKAMLEKSIAIDTGSSEEEEKHEAVQMAATKRMLEGLLAETMDGCMVIATVLGSGHAGVLESGAWGPGFPHIAQPEAGQSRMLIGQKQRGTTTVLQPWALGESRLDGKGPIHVILKVPISKEGLQQAASDASKIWEGGISATPLWHEMGRAGDGVIADPEAAFNQLKETTPLAPVAGYSYKPGMGLAIIGHTSGVRAGKGWTSKSFPFQSRSSQPTLDLPSRIKTAFASLVAQGLAPNAAAAQALVLVKEEMAKEIQSVQIVKSLGRYGNPRPAEGESWAFDDTELAFPHQAMAEWREALPVARLRKIRLWNSSSMILGLQAGYDLPLAAGGDFVWGPEHRASGVTAYPVSGTLLELAADEVLTKMETRTGPEGIEGLSLYTNKRKLGDFGRLQSLGKERREETHVDLTEKNWEVLAFNGSVSSKGLQKLGLVVASSLLPASPASSDAGLPHAWGLFTTCPMDRATRQMLLWSADEARTLGALRAARRYLGNCVKEPANAKFRLIRCRTAFYNNNLGRVPGSGLLMASLGFQHLARGAEDEACYELPLRNASPMILERLIQRLDANISRLEKIVDSSKA